MLRLGTGLVVLSAACGGPSPVAEPSPSPVPSPRITGDPRVRGSITATDQISDGSSIVVKGAWITLVDGWVTVYDEKDGEPGEIVGTAWFPKGRAEDIVVELDRPVSSGPLWPTVHCDISEPKVFEFPGPDIPVETVGGDVARVRIELTVP